MTPTVNVLVVAAMRGETKALRRRLVGLRRDMDRSVDSWVGHFLGRPRVVVHVVHCGVGRKAVQRFSKAWAASGIASRSFDLALIIGLAGGLDPQLGVGSLVVAQSMIDAESGDSKHLEAAPEDVLEHAPEGVVVTSKDLLVDPQQKRELWERTGSLVGAIVDMETFHLCDALKGSAASIRCARVVSDGAAESLPAFLSGSDGVHWPRLAAGLARHPLVIKELLRLRRGLNDAAESLATWVENICCRES